MSIKASLIEMKKFYSNSDKWNKGYKYIFKKEYQKEMYWSGIKAVESCCLTGVRDLFLPTNLIPYHQMSHEDMVLLAQSKANLIKHMEFCLPKSFINLIDFNDKIETTYSDIHKFLDKCIETAPN